MGGCLITCIGVVTYRCWLESNRVSATRFSMELASPALIKSESSLTGRAVRCASAWGIGIGTAVSLLAVSSSLSDPMRPLWQAGVAAALVGLAAAMAWFSHRHFFGYASIALTMLTITLVWLGLPSGSGTRTVWDLYTWNLSFAAVCASGWLAAEVWSQRRRQRSIFAAPDIVAAHRFVAGAGIILLLFGVSVMTAAGSLGVPGRIQPSGPNGILCTALFGLLLLGLLWDSRSRLGLAGLYVWGLAVESLVIDALGLDVPRGLLGMGCALATHSALTGALWRNGAKLVAIGDSLKIPDPLTGLKRTSHWLPVANFVASLLAGTIAFGGATGFGQRSLRIVAAFIPVFLAYGAAALAQKERRKWQQQLCLLWATAAAVLIGWADIEPQFGSADLLARAIRLLMVLSAVAFVYQLVILRWVAPASDWRMTLRRSSLIAAAAGLITLLCVMTLEVTIFFGGADRIVPVSDTQLIAVSLVLVGLIVALLASALSNERDPFALSERGRMTYVYGAQAAAGLLFAHIYLCRQMWFSGFMGPYWPYIVMAIAFGGVGSSELFRRQGIRVLAEPLERTGTFLPLLPAIGWWMLASKTDYSLLLFVVGLMYLLLSYTRKSHVSGIAAAVAGNGALWSLLFDRGFEPLHQPQLWLIPPAASILIAVELNRSRLPQATQTALRYACLLVIYVSSTTEMFIRGIGDNLLPPIILLTLSLAGAFLGMILRIRAFLYLGSVFVFLSLTSMVWHASKSIDHIWPWWAFGIAVGIGVLIFFGVFEKRRDDVRRLASQLREWDK